ncbi:hypothetical protein SLE2022_405930 [Rubroshorea leprosula]
MRTPTRSRRARRRRPGRRQPPLLPSGEVGQLFGLGGPRMPAGLHRVAREGAGHARSRAAPAPRGGGAPRRRLTHFALATRLLPLPDAIERPVQAVDAPNPWGFALPPSRLRGALDALAIAGAHTPLGWPILWIALALGVLVVGGAAPEARLAVPLAFSALLYGGSYLAVGVASELRYHLWTELAAFIATVLVLADVRAIPRRRLAFAALPALVVLAAGCGLRA